MRDLSDTSGVWSNWTKIHEVDTGTEPELEGRGGEGACLLVACDDSCLWLYLLNS